MSFVMLAVPLFVLVYTFVNYQACVCWEVETSILTIKVHPFVVLIVLAELSLFIPFDAKTETDARRCFHSPKRYS
jgi:hypothetical protein